MLYQGKTIQVEHNEGIIELIFDNKEGSVNVFNKITLEELNEAVETISNTEGVKGLIARSGKSTFIVGADITEFGETFKEPKEVLIQWLTDANSIFNRIEDFPFPTVSLVNGTALGGGCEMALSTDYRILDSKGSIGLPEISLGIIPGFGGTVRLPRLIGVDSAIHVIVELGGAMKSLRADKALKYHVVDAVVEADQLLAAGKHLLNQAIEGKLNWESRKEQKKSPIPLSQKEQMATFMVSTQFVKAASRGYLAPVETVKVLQAAAKKDRAGALLVEAKAFAKLAKTSVAESLIGLFHNDQVIKKKGRKYKKIAKKIDKAAVLGAGIMGGGIAYQSAYKNVPIVMKDINQKGIDQGMNEAAKLLSKLVKRGRIDSARMSNILANINPTLSYGEEDFSSVDIVVEAVVENKKVKHIVLKQIEDTCDENTIITSNTSSISINYLAEALERPENFCGMHFFNPVHKMPLVEIIRGEKTSEEAIATTVAYATKMGKVPIVVNDCAGFLVNRVLFPYFAGFQGLVNDGANFKTIDKTMEKFGWPMGPAYLMDVVGIDTAYKVSDVMAEGYPDRMMNDIRTSINVMVENERHGQKNGIGYYKYEKDKRGRPKKKDDPAVLELLKGIQANGTKEFSEEEIIERMMIPMIIETARCFEEEIVDTVNEADMGLIMGIGFPPFRGGAFRYADQVGLAKICEMADKYAHLGKLYHPTDRMREMAANGETYYKS